MRTPVPILLYHSISTTAMPSAQRWTVHPKTFAAHMAYVHEHQYTPLTVTQLARALSDRRICLPNRPVVITFDDGLADFYTGALPILRQHGFVATLYVTSGLVGRTSRGLYPRGHDAQPMLSWDQLATIQASGIECGAHSVSHPQLDLLSRRAARDEIVHCKEALEQRLGREVATFAYPHGYYSANVRRLVQEAGYSSACAVKHALSATTDDPFALARIIVPDTEASGIDRFGDLLAGHGLPVAPMGERVRTKGWRAVRRSSRLLSRLSRRETRACVERLHDDRSEPMLARGDLMRR
jgi:peptidoglycan/xylan/chitin deacetylase (PgdA/CDA1 family)